jgi:signal transduction histidine kinase
MANVIRFLKRHTLWLGFVAVVIPLAILIGMQFVWLRRLEKMSAIAHQADLHNYVEVVGKEIRYFYRTAAERALNLPSSIFTQGHLEKAAYHWKKKKIQGARTLFLVDYTRETTGNFLIYDAERHRLVTPPASDESLAIIVACLPWQLTSVTGSREDQVGLTVDERDSEHRIILNPITDEESRLVGLVGMVLDEKFFRKELLPTTIKMTLSHFFPDQAVDDLVVTVRNERDQAVFGPRGWEPREYAADLTFPFVFTDWTLGLYSKGSGPEQWARASFIFNMTLSGLLAVVLLGGVVMALRSANKAWNLSEMKGDFVSNVSHELRTPLASIRVFAELLKLGKVPTAQKAEEYGEYIEAESHRLSRLIDNILDFSRIESRNKTYSFARGDIGEVVDAIMRTFEVRMRQCGFQVSMERPRDPLPPVRIDIDAFGQAVNNLLDNAVKYSKDSKRIEVRLAHDNDHVEVSVRDHGIGIAREEQRKIFERFHRVSTGLVHDVKGNGLGLSIVHHVVQAHGGSVNVESEPGRGSTFFIRLPVVRGADAGPSTDGAGNPVVTDVSSGSGIHG